MTTDGKKTLNITGWGLDVVLLDCRIGAAGGLEAGVISEIAFVVGFDVIEVAFDVDVGVGVDEEVDVTGVTTTDDDED